MGRNIGCGLFWIKEAAGDPLATLAIGIKTDSAGPLIPMSY